MKNIFLLVFLWLSVLIGNAQVLVTFEDGTTIPSLSTATAATVDNPLKNSVNSSAKVGYYKKAAAEWQYFTMNFATPIQIKKNNTLTFKVNAGAAGRIFAKFWLGSKIVTQDWAPTYDFKPTPNKWVECTMTLADSAMDKTFDKLEIATVVDNNTVTADVYLDDFVLSNPLLGDGSPQAVFTTSASSINVNGTVTFDASKSYDIDGTIKSYNWSFGDGSTTSTDQKVSHVFSTSGIYNVVLTVTDNENKIKTKQAYIFVLDPVQKISAFRITSPSIEINKKVEGIFQLTSRYTNVYNPNEVKVDASITLPDASKIVVPCFYYEKPKVSGTGWAIDSTFSSWMLRFSSNQVGTHKVVLTLTDKTGTYSSAEYSVDVKAASNLGIIKVDKDNKQYYRRTSGEPYFPMGINVGWANTDLYAKILTNLGNGGANLIRYWHTGFANQALEWKKGGIYKGLGFYSQQAAGMSDSILALCEKNNLNMQLTIFQHGQFSETTDSNWADNPLNKVNGGYISTSEEFFYNDSCKQNTRNKLRYIIARWGYSPNIFAWELFNEVNFTGNATKTAKWFPGILQWHSEMSKYLKDNDPFKHITTTSASGEDKMLNAMDSISALDVLQYHVYNDNLLNIQCKSDSTFQVDFKHKGVINGEYGLGGTGGDVSLVIQRASIWNSIMNRTPQFMWEWNHYTDTEWSNLFAMPTEFAKDIDFAKTTNLTTAHATAVNGIQQLSVNGYTADKVCNLYVNDPTYSSDITSAVLRLTNLPYAYYTIKYYFPLADSTMTVDNVALVSPANKIVLPKFSQGVGIHIAYKSAYTLPIAIAGNDTLIGTGAIIHFDGGKSYSQTNKALTYKWTLISKPSTSSLTLTNSTAKTMDVTFDLSGKYRIGLVVNDGSESAVNYVDISVSNIPVAVLGNDTVLTKSMQRLVIKGTRSYDADGDALTYKWALISGPKNTISPLLALTGSKTYFQTDVEGTYLITLVVNDGYSDSKADTIKVTYSLNGVTGISENKIDNVQIYPNPTSQLVTILLNQNVSDAVSVELCDLTGKQIVRLDKQFASSIELDLSKYALSNGIYLLRITSGSQTKIQKIIYQK